MPVDPVTDGQHPARRVTHQRAPRLRIGTSGFRYAHWSGLFYPEALPESRWFDFYAERFSTVEINATFYRLPDPAVFERWRAHAPRDFCFALKFSRYGTHMKRLLAPRETIGRFLEKAELLGRHLGPILVQLPPRFRADPGRLDSFLAAAPRRRRWAVGFRDPSWLQEEVFAVLRRHRAALCLHDLIERHPRMATTDFVYLRFHGGSLGGGYSHQALVAGARRIGRSLDEGLDVFAYFNNDLDAHAIADASRLLRYVR